MKDSESIKNIFIEAALLSSKALAQGDYKTANKQAKILHNIIQEIKKGMVDKDILLELLNNETIAVKSYAASDLLRLKYHEKQAEKTLNDIASSQGANLEENLRIHSAKWALKKWKETHD
jgi:hypothetical protein